MNLKTIVKSILKEMVPVDNFMKRKIDRIIFLLRLSQYLELINYQSLESKSKMRNKTIMPQMKSIGIKMISESHLK